MLEGLLIAESSWNYWAVFYYWTSNFSWVQINGRYIALFIWCL